jgi:capsular exopolysaccharide synthesis family protein
MDNKPQYIAQEENDFQKLLEMFLLNKYFFIISVIICLSIAFVINKFTVRIYNVSTKVLIHSAETQQIGGMKNSAERLSLTSFIPDYSFQNEIIMLQNSSTLASQLVYELDLSVNYYQKDRWKYREIYKSSPFRVFFPRSKPQPIGVQFKIEPLNDRQFRLTAEAESYYLYDYEKSAASDFKTKLNINTVVEYGKLIESRDFSFMVAKDSLNTPQVSQIYAFEFVNTAEMAGSIIGSFMINLMDQNGTAVEVSYQSPCPEKAVDIVNLFVKLYQDYSLAKKNYTADQTIGYIDKQLNVVSDSLQATDKQLQNFKISNKVIDLEGRTTTFTSQLQTLETRRAELATQKKYYEYVLNYLQNEDLSNLVVPTSLGIQDVALNNFITQIVTAQSQKNALISNKQEKNPNVARLDTEIANLKKTIEQNINYVLKTTEIEIEELDKRFGSVQREFEKLPRTESRMAFIERKYNISNEIYTFLLQRRTEANIAKASNRPDSEVLEPAKVTGKVSPDTFMNLGIGGVVGLVIPIIFLFFKNSVNNRIKAEDTIEKLTQIPVLGKILHNYRRNPNIVMESPNSPISESFRTLRTNLDFYLKDKNKKVILISSSIEGEGKSFTALNLATCYAQLKRKTILLDFDLRKPGTYFENKNLIGLSTYLVNKCTLDDIIMHSPNEKLHYITSGPIPPNPIELMNVEKMDHLFNLLKNNYDYIFVDTSPLAQVSDAYMLTKYADFITLITRINYVEKGIFSLVVKDLQRKGINNCCVVMNDNRHYRDQYGYGYGYQKKKWGMFKRK